MQADGWSIFSWSSFDWRRSRSGGAGVRVCSQGFTEAYCA